MPTSIPYNHQSLVLGNIAQNEVMDKIDQMSRVQSQTNAAQDKLNSFIQAKRSVTMTINEVKSMKLDMSSMEQKIKELDQAITAAANEYLTIFLNNENILCDLKTELSLIGKSTHTPISVIDERSELKAKPLFSDSLKLDSQYFSLAENSTKNTVENIEQFVKNSTGKGGNELALAASEQVVNQAQNHRLCGTLVVVANCTHRNVGVFDPLIINADKAINAWNTIYPSNRIDDPEHNVEDSDSNQWISIITGAAYGSSFVGMVHILESEKSKNTDFERIKNQLEAKLEIGGWLSHVSGGLGIDPQYLDEVKSVINTRSISTHISVVTMGMIPTIKSNTYKSSAMQIVHLPPDKIGSNNDDLQSVSSAAKTTAAHNQRSEMRAKTVKNVLQTTADKDNKQNNVLNINSLLTALDNYIERANTAGSLIGVPISFFTQRLTKSDILSLWRDKHYPTSPPAETE